jgi:hypothetical protein
MTAIKKPNYAQFRKIEWLIFMGCWMKKIDGIHIYKDPKMNTLDKTIYLDVWIDYHVLNSEYLFSTNKGRKWHPMFEAPRTKTENYSVG